jgi:hypothetical protein
VLPLHKLVMPRRFSKIVFHKNDIWRRKDYHWQIHLPAEYIVLI